MPKIKLKNLDRSGAANNDTAKFKVVSGSWVPSVDEGNSSGYVLPSTPKQTIIHLSGALESAVIVPSPNPGFVRFIGPSRPYYVVSPLQTGIRIKSKSNAPGNPGPLESQVTISGTLITSSLVIDKMSVDNTRFTNSDNFGPLASAFSPSGWYIPTFLSSSEALIFTILSSAQDNPSYEATVAATYCDIPEDNIFIKRTILTTSYVDIIPEPPVGFVHVPFPLMSFADPGTTTFSDPIVSPMQFANVSSGAADYPDIITRHSNSVGDLEVTTGSLNFATSQPIYPTFTTHFLGGNAFNGLGDQSGHYPDMIEVSQSFQARFKNVEEGGLINVAVIATTVYWRLPV